MGGGHGRRGRAFLEPLGDQSTRLAPDGLPGTPATCACRLVRQSRFMDPHGLFGTSETRRAMIKDIFAEGIAAGWKVHDGSKLSGDLNLDADVVIIGSGAGGGIS